ncbi:MAG: MFS transporter [Arenicellales bacterium]|jgi:MFS family permease|nr:MFS transporter [Arenicellales bacterium]
MPFVGALRRNVLILAVCQALMLSGSSLIVAASALVGLTLSVEKVWATLPIACMYCGTLTVTFPASVLMKRIGRRAGFIVGLMVGFAGAMVATWAILDHNFVAFAVGSFLIGILNGFGQYYRFAAVDISGEAYRGRAISWVLAGGILAAFIGPNLANYSRDMLMGIPFAGSYASLLILYGLSILLVSQIQIAVPGEHERSGEQRPLAQIARQPKYLVAVIGAMIAYGVMNLVMTSTPLAMASHDHGFSDTALVIQWHVLAMFAPSFFTGNLIARFGVIRIMSVGAILLLASILIGLGGISVFHFLFELVFLGLGWNFLFIGGTTLLTETYTVPEKAKAQGLNDLLVFGMVALTALSSGFLHEWAGWRALNYSVLPAVLLALGMVLWLGRRRQTD